MNAIAHLSPGAVGPDARAAVLVEVQASGASNLDGLTIDAVVEHVADRVVWVGEEAVLTRTLLRRLGWLCNRDRLAYSTMLSARVTWPSYCAMA